MVNNSVIRRRISSAGIDIRGKLYTTDQPRGTCADVRNREENCWIGEQEIGRGE